MTGWVTRDMDGALYLYLNVKPYKGKHAWRPAAALCLDRNTFPDVRWENESPMEVEVILKRKHKQP